MTEGAHIRTELDSHADTCVVGEETALVVEDLERSVRVYGYDDKAGAPKTCKTVNAVLAYDQPDTGETYMLMVHQAILVPHMRVNLLGTMQLRDNDVKINEEPKHMATDPTDDHHSISVPPTTQDDVPLRIPLLVHNVTSYFPTRKPTREEFESSELEMRRDLTYESPEWDPGTSRFQEQEDAMLDTDGKLRDVKWGTRRIVSALQSIPQQSHPDSDFGPALIANVNVKYVSAKEKRDACVGSVKSGKRGTAIGPETLAKNWGIGLNKAKRTLEATTQHGVRTMLHPTLMRRFRTNDRQLRYRRLNCDMFTDTMEAQSKSWFRGNRYAQVFATRFGWARAFPMKKKSEAHEGLSLLARRDGVPATLVMDGSKEQTMGEFRRVARQIGVHVKQTEPHSPWQNAAEGTIRELKRGAGRKMAAKKSPAGLWDHCLELEAFIRSHTALDHYELNGEVPETLLSGQTADISPFVECGWYDWVKFYDQGAQFPEPKEVYGRWLGPSTDVGPAMTAKILNSNKQVLHRSSYRPISDDEVANPEERTIREKFDADVNAKLGQPIDLEELSTLDPALATPEFEPYDGQLEGTAATEEEPTPEDEDNYVGAEVNLPFGGTMRAGKVKRRARDSAGELYGRRHPNPILDTRTYEDEFPTGEQAEIAANVIAENMYAQCDPDGNQHMLMESIVDHKTDGTAVKFVDRYVTRNGRKYHRKTTAGWKLCIEWKNGSTSWERLADLKQSYPIEVAEYAISQGIEHEPAFGWLGAICDEKARPNHSGCEQKVSQTIP